ncbi:MAG: hypothetical protein OXG56_06655 [Gammaproteobacteria bacterium]|nr:hypothetical protein [Gammaproteobacteria bacterium]
MKVVGIDSLRLGVEPMGLRALGELGLPDRLAGWGSRVSLCL